KRPVAAAVAVRRASGRIVTSARAKGATHPEEEPHCQDKASMNSHAWIAEQVLCHPKKARVAADLLGRWTPRRPRAWSPPRPLAIRPGTRRSYSAARRYLGMRLTQVQP